VANKLIENLIRTAFSYVFVKFGRCMDLQLLFMYLFILVHIACHLQHRGYMPRLQLGQLQRATRAPSAMKPSANQCQCK
jgi:hypothetical protein